MGEHVVILGGGVIGLSCAFELQNRGYQVTVLELSSCGGQASGAAAGMLAPYSENIEGPDDFFQLCLDSLRLFPEWERSLREVSKQSCAYTTSGSLYLAYHEADILALEGRLLWQRQFGSTGVLLTADQVLQHESHLSPHVIAALHTPEECHIYAPDYVKSLEKACRIIGVDIYEHLEKLDIVEWEHEVLIRSSGGQSFQGDKLLICSGAWVQEMGEQLRTSFPVYPIRGQICAYENSGHLAKHMIFCNQGYVVAKDNGALVCGASEDVAGYDTSVTTKGIARLKSWNGKVIPALDDLTPFHSWAGLRPSTPDGMPLIGQLSYAKHVIVAAGHYRNGILLSPVTAKLTADIVDGTSDPMSIAAFSPERFIGGERD